MALGIGTALAAIPWMEEAKHSESSSAGPKCLLAILSCR